jgi:hypothetical protein
MQLQYICITRDANISIKHIHNEVWLLEQWSVWVSPFSVTFFGTHFHKFAWTRCIHVKLRNDMYHTVQNYRWYIWCSCDRTSLKCSSKYDQQNATLYNILYCCQCSSFSAHHQELKIQNCTHSIWCVLSLLAATASMGGYNPPMLVVAHTRCCVYSFAFWAPDDGWRNCPKHVEHWQQ